MLRNLLFSNTGTNHFRHRGTELLRIEALSDAVFAFSVSLLVASLEVPQTFDELLIIARGAIPFFCTVALLFMFWYQQYVFFRRYGLNDFTTIVLNLFYLAVIVFYVYPLKFLFSLLIASWTGMHLFPKAAEKGLTVLAANQFPQLIILFSIGYFAIWTLIWLMHRHVLNQHASLKFETFELLTTRKEISGALLNACIGLFAILFGWLQWNLCAGICYMLILPIMIANDLFYRKQRKARSGKAHKNHSIATNS